MQYHATDLETFDGEAMEARTREMMLQYIKLVLGSAQVGLSVYLRARRDHNVGLVEMIHARDHCFQKMTAMSGVADHRKEFKTFCKAMRDCLLPSLYNIQIVYPKREVAVHLCTFATSWVRKFIASSRNAISAVEDILELSGMWTQSVLLNRSMSKQGIAFMALVEDYYVQRAFDICSLKLAHIEPTEAEKSLIDQSQYAFIDNPMHVAIANAIVQCVNNMRYFAHRKLLSRMEEHIAAQVASVPELQEFAQKALAPYKLGC
jgi:hypothetical protein